MSVSISHADQVIEANYIASTELILPQWLATRFRFFTLLAFWFAGQVALRCLTSPAVDLDESEQLVFSQTFQWGYSAQPPLYTWLQIIFFQVFSPSIFALALFKNLLLFITYVAVYTAGRSIGRSHMAGTLAALSLLFIPQYAWEAQRDLTHSVLATAGAAATVTVALRLITQPSLGWYAALGACVGIGLLSKYSYAYFAAGLLIGAMFVGTLRRVLFDLRIVAAVIVAALILSPHFWWGFNNLEATLSAAHKLHIRSDAAWWHLIFTPAIQVAGSFAMHVISVVMVFLILAWKQVASLRQVSLNHPLLRWLLIAFVAAPISAMIVMLVAHSTAFKGRWLQPVFLLLPIVSAVYMAPLLNRAAARRLVGAACAVGIVVALILPVRLCLPVEWQQSTILNTDFAVLASTIRPQAERTDVILTDGKLVGGNLRLHFPKKTICTPQFSTAKMTHSTTQYLCIFNAAYRDLPDPGLTQLAGELNAEIVASSIYYIEAPLRFRPGRHRRFGMTLLTAKPRKLI